MMDIGGRCLVPNLFEVYKPMHNAVATGWSALWRRLAWCGTASDTSSRAAMQLRDYREVPRC